MGLVWQSDDDHQSMADKDLPSMSDRRALREASFGTFGRGGRVTLRRLPLGPIPTVKPRERRKGTGASFRLHPGHNGRGAARRQVRPPPRPPSRRRPQPHRPLLRSTIGFHYQKCWTKYHDAAQLHFSPKYFSNTPLSNRALFNTEESVLTKYLNYRIFNRNKTCRFFIDQRSG